MSANVRDVMTAPVISIQNETPFQTIAELLTAHQIAALPVLDPAGKLVGVVSESDLLHKEGHPHTAGQPPALRLGRRYTERTKAAGRSAGTLMTAPPVTI